MFKLKYRNSVSDVEVSFDSYMDLVYYVAVNKIGDDDFISITMEDQTIEGLDNLYSYVARGIEAQKAAEAAMAAMLDDEVAEAEVMGIDPVEPEPVDCSNSELFNEILNEFDLAVEEA